MISPARPLAPSTVLVLAVNSLQQFIMDIVPCLKPIPIREYQERMSVSYSILLILMILLKYVRKRFKLKNLTQVNHIFKWIHMDILI